MNIVTTFIFPSVQPIVACTQCHYVAIATIARKSFMQILW